MPDGVVKYETGKQLKGRTWKKKNMVKIQRRGGGKARKGQAKEIKHQETRHTSTAEDTHAGLWPQPRASSPAAYWIPYLSITVFPAKENSAASNYFRELVNFILGGEESIEAHPLLLHHHPPPFLHATGSEGARERALPLPSWAEGKCQERCTSVSATPVMSP